MARNLSEKALAVLRQRYFREGENWYGLCSRVVEAIMPEESKVRAFQQIYDRKFLPNTPTLINAGKEEQMLFACFVLPVEDSMEDIFYAIRNMAMIQKNGGGTGFSFGRLREKGAKVHSTNGESSGVVSFMEVFNSATNSIKQGGVRRGANMAVLPVDHPEIMDFIQAKSDTSKLTNFNISVGITDKFMRAVIDNKSFDLNSRRDGGKNTVWAKDIFNALIEQMHSTGEPGCLFLDHINNANPNRNLGDIEATNPCGESPLLPYESCVLGSIDVAKFYNNGSVDYDALDETIEVAVEFLDNMIDKNHYVLPEIEEATLKTRKIGLGIMGWADLLYQLAIPYNSDEAFALASALMQHITKKAMLVSMRIGKEKGCYPELENADITVHKKFGDTLPCDSFQYLRNAFVTIIAPTGSLSIIADTSSGIEPNFALAYKRRTDTGLELEYFNEHLKTALEEVNLYRQSVIDRIIETNSLEGIEGVPEWMKAVFVTAHDIGYSDHLRMQAKFQEWTTGSISKTINFPNTATKDEIMSAIILAWKSGCKGVTVYRDGCRPHQILTKSTPVNEEAKTVPRVRGNVTSGKTHRIPTACGKLYVVINRDDQGLCETFAQMGKGGNCASAQLEAIARLTSLCLRAKVSPDSIIKQLKGISCTGTIWHDGKKVHSCADAIATAMQDDIGVEIDVDYEIVDDVVTKKSCPDCNNELSYMEGCLKCQNCGWSKC